MGVTIESYPVYNGAATLQNVYINVRDLRTTKEIERRDLRKSIKKELKEKLRKEKEMKRTRKKKRKKKKKRGGSNSLKKKEFTNLLQKL